MKTNESEQPEDIVIAMLRLPDANYFEFDEASEDRLIDALIFMDDFHGMAIGTPQSVDVDTQKSLPMLWVRRASGLRSWQVEVMRNSTVVVSDLTRGMISLHYAFAGPKRISLSQIPRSAFGERPDRDRAEGVTVAVERLDLRSIANLPWKPGRLATTLLIHDWVSNTVVTSLTRPGPGPSSEKEQAVCFPRSAALALEEQYRKAIALPQPKVTFGRSRDIPELEEPRVVLLVPEEFSTSDPRWLIHGAAKLRLAPGAIVEPPLKGEAARSPSEVQGQVIQVPDAVVRLMLILAQLDDAKPRQILLEVPVHSQTPLKAGDVVDVGFSFDLKAELGGIMPPSTQLYLVGGEHISTPHPLVGGGD